MPQKQFYVMIPIGSFHTKLPTMGSFDVDRLMLKVITYHPALEWKTIENDPVRYAKCVNRAKQVLFEIRYAEYLGDK